METEQTIETYFDQHAVDGALTDDAMARLLTGDLGDTAVVAEAGITPEPAPAKDIEPEQQPAAEKPEGDGKPEEATAEGKGEEAVILAKDGKNTIPYEKLTEAREEAKAAKAETQALMQEMESIKEQIAALNAGKPQDQQPEQQETQQPESVDVTQLERDWHEAMLDDDTDKAIEIRGRINAEIRRQALEEADANYQAKRDAEAQQQAQLSTQELLDKAAVDVVKAYPSLDLESDTADKVKVAEVIEYRDFLITSKGVAPHEALKQAASRIMGEPTKQAEGDTSAQKEHPLKVESKVKERTPTTMSDIPAGTAVHADEAEALTQMSNTALLSKMMGMDPAKIEQMTARLV